MGDIGSQLPDFQANASQGKLAPFHDLQREIIDQWGNINDILQDLRLKSVPGEDEPIMKSASSQDIIKLRKIGAPGPPISIVDAVQEAHSIFDYRVRSNHPKFFGFVPSNVTQISWLADVLVSTFNVHAGGSFASPGPVAIETELIEWLASRLHFPQGAGGLFVSGGSIANMMAITVARDQKLQREDYSRGIIYVGQQAHYSSSKAARILGFHEDQIRTVECDDLYQMKVESLRNQVKADKSKGLVPFMIVSTFGSTETGAIDPIQALSVVARDEGLWLHVDGAFGASCALSSSRPKLSKELGYAHSVTWDAHKWLFQNYGCGMLLVRDKSNLVSSFHARSDFIDHAGRIRGEEAEFYDLGMELTRPSRAMSLWFTLRVLGVERIGEMIDHGMNLAKLIDANLNKMPDWEILTPAKLCIVTFRYKPSHRTEEELSRLNTEIPKALVADNTAGIMTIKLGGTIALRVCCTTSQLTEEDNEKLVSQMDETAARVNKSIM